jgi:hypothetical protein
VIEAQFWLYAGSSEPSFASLPAVSLLGTSSCPGTHAVTVLQGSIASASLPNLMHACWDEAGGIPSSPSTIAELSRKKNTSPMLESAQARCCTNFMGFSARCASHMRRKLFVKVRFIYNKRQTFISVDPAVIRAHR